MYVYDTPPAFAHATMDTAALYANQEYCTHDIVFFWQRLTFFSQETRSRFTVEGISYSRELYFAAENALQHIIRASDPRLHQHYGRKIRNFDIAGWEHDREYIMLVSPYAKVAQNLAM